MVGNNRFGTSGGRTKRCPDCGQIMSLVRDHYCVSIDRRGPRFCTTCGVQLRNTGYERWKTICGKCDKKIQRQKERDLRLDLVILFGGRCQMCGYDRCQDCLEFHHIDPETKTREHCLPQIRDHAELFRLLCNRCHRELHVNERKANGKS